jgi:pyruvate formate lyase activating enzyme
MNRRRFIESSLTGMGLASISPAFYQGNKAGTLLSPGIGKNTREAMFYTITPQGARCELCPNDCNVTEIKPGDCKTKVFRNGKLYTLAYGNPYFFAIEKPEERSLYHYCPGLEILSVGTAGCTQQCLYCNVNEVSQKSPDQVPKKVIFPPDVIVYCQKQNIRTISFTYSEPVAFYEYMLDTAMLAKQHGIKNILTSNGYIHPNPLKKLLPYMDAAVIDVKALNEAVYLKISGGSIKPVFEALKIIKESKVWLEITYLLIPGWTDNLELLDKMGKWMVENGFQDTPFHINRFIPMYRLSQLSPPSGDILSKARQTIMNTGLTHVYANNPADPTAFITHCPHCHKSVITRENNSLIGNTLKSGVCNYCGNKLGGIWN